MFWSRRTQVYQKMTSDSETTQNTAPVQSESGVEKATKKPRVVNRVPGAPRKPKTDEPPRKRGPPRPHRKLPQDVLDGRIGKLRKRIERARGQLEDAERHIDGYEKEAKYREQEKKD